MHLRITQKEVLWRVLVVVFCALVFFFALHAKTAVYNSSAPKITPSTASKLWVSGQKTETHSLESSTNLWFWMTLFCLFSLRFRSERMVKTAFVAPVPRNRPLCYLHRFLRPPPVQL